MHIHRIVNVDTYVCGCMCTDEKIGTSCYVCTTCTMGRFTYVQYACMYVHVCNTSSCTCTLVCTSVAEVTGLSRCSSCLDIVS